MTTAAQTQFRRERAAYWKQVQENRDAIDRLEAQRVTANQVAHQRASHTIEAWIIGIALLAGFCYVLHCLVIGWLS